MMTVHVAAVPMFSRGRCCAGRVCRFGVHTRFWSPPAQVASRGDTAMAVTLLTKYVSLYVNDLEAWEELAAMYLQVRTQRASAVLSFLTWSRHHWYWSCRQGACRHQGEAVS